MSKTTWERTSVQYLLRNRANGRYFGRWTVSGKQIWRMLDTDVFSVAKLRLADEAAKIGALRSSSANVRAGKGSMRDLILVYTQRLQQNPDLKPSSKAAKLIGLKKLAKTWPGLEALDPRKVTSEAIAAWVTRFKSTGTAYTPPGAKKVLKGNSATSVNRAIDTLRHVLQIAVERGAIHLNPVPTRLSDGTRLKKKVVKRNLVLPTFADVQRLFAAIENNGAIGGWGSEAADLCRFLAFSGCRIGEVRGVTWACVDWERKMLHVRGENRPDAQHGALKTESSDRFVPLFADLGSLLRKVIERRKTAAAYSESGKPDLEPADRILRLGECQKSIDTACAKLGISRITHHDLRHLFATRCIESGVDIPTVARWLGHSDGGVLAMRTYGHLRLDHSQAQAAKVDFGGAS